MPKPTIQELQKIGREAFGRELSEAQVEAYRGRLPTMAQNVRRIRDWERRLRDAEPALVQRVLSGGGDD
jgi:hypothetical protein